MALKFKIPLEVSEIPFLDGAILKLKRLSMDDRVKHKKEATEKGYSEDETNYYLAERSLIGWKDILDDTTGKELAFNDYSRAKIFEAMLNDKNTFDSFTVFIKGNLGN